MGAPRRPPALVVIALFVLGCGDGGPRRLPVSGTVTLDGKPLESGSITFVPEAAGPAGSAPVEAGAFTLGRREGLLAGAYRVEVVWARPTGKVVPNPDVPGTTVEETRNIIPGRYNTRSELRAEVKAGDRNEFTFALTTGGGAIKKKGAGLGRR